MTIVCTIDRFFWGDGGIKIFKKRIQTSRVLGNVGKTTEIKSGTKHIIFNSYGCKKRKMTIKHYKQ